MTTKGIADIVFCLDASGSMSPCFDGVRNHVVDFIKSLESDKQRQWDWRMDFVAHSAYASTFQHRSLYHDNLQEALYGNNRQAGKFFTSDTEVFKKGLSRIELGVNESPLIALDFCLDFPWRDSAGCHRVIVMMTDEPFESGEALDMQRAQLDSLIQKTQQLRVMLFIVTPSSSLFDQLAATDRSEYEVVDSAGDGLAGVNFREVLAYVGKSVSVSQQTMKAEAAPRGLFGQASW